MTEGSQGINSVDIAVEILTFIARNHGEVRAFEIAMGCTLSKSRLHKYLVSLSRAGMIQQNEKGAWQLGHTLSYLATQVGETLGPVSLLNNRLCAFRNTLNHSTGVVVPTSGGLILRHYNRSFRNIDIDFLQNTPVPVHTSAAGQVYISYDRYLPQNEHEETLINHVRQVGYAVRYNPTEGIPGAQSIACPLLANNGELIAIGVTMGFFDNNELISFLAGELIKAVNGFSLSEKK